MATIVLDKRITKKLNELILESCQTGYKENTEEIHFVSSEDSLAVMIPETIYQSDNVLFRNTTTNANVLDQHLRSLLVTIAEELRPLIEECSGQEVLQIIPLIDLKAGWMIAFYRFQL